MEIEHIDSILDVDEHGNPRFTCSVKPDYRDQWRYETNSDKPQRTTLSYTNETETNGDIIAREWAKFVEIATHEEKVKALTEIIRRLVQGTSV